MSNRSDTPIFDALWEKYNATPIYDQLVSLYEAEEHERIVSQYRPTFVADRYFELPETQGENKMNKWQELVNEFREAMDLPLSDGPRQLTSEEAELHIKMIRDEFEKEFVPFIRSNNLIEFYDAGIDMIVYIIGAMSNAGMDLDPGFIEIMRSNMSKMDPVTKKPIKAGPNDPSGEPEGKVLKGPNYSPPNLGAILNDLSRYGHEDNRVYKNVRVPLTFGVNGPKIGEGVINMDHDGNMMFEGVIDVETAIPIVDMLGYQVSALSVGSETVPPVLDDTEVTESSRIFDEALRKGGEIIAKGETPIAEGYLTPKQRFRKELLNEVPEHPLNGKNIIELADGAPDHDPVLFPNSSDGTLVSPPYDR